MCQLAAIQLVPGAARAGVANLEAEEAVKEVRVGMEVEREVSVATQGTCHTTRGRRPTGHD